MTRSGGIGHRASAIGAITAVLGMLVVGGASGASAASGVASGAAESPLDPSLVPVAESLDARRCSLMPFPLPKSDRRSFFIGTTTAESVRAGPGAIEVDEDAASDASRMGLDVGPSGPRYMGLVVAVERGHSRDPDFPADGDSLVLVPWDYDMSCRTLPWRGSAQFLPPAHRGFFQVSLRDRADWIGGRPTADVFNVGVAGYPIPRSSRAERALTLRYGTPLTADQVFEIFEAAPWSDEVAERGWDALGDLRRWAERADSATGSSRTVAGMISPLLYGVESWAVRRLRPEMAGTWRLELVLPSGRRLERFVRTSDTPRSPTTVSRVIASGAGPSSAPSPPMSLADRLQPSMNGFNLSFWHAATETALRSDSLPLSRKDQGEWGFSIATESEVIDGETVWIAHAEAGEWARIIEHPELTAFADAFSAEYRERRAAGDLNGAEIRFIRAANGDFRMHGSWRAGGEILSVSGERVSTRTVPGRR